MLDYYIASTHHTDAVQKNPPKPQSCVCVGGWVGSISRSQSSPYLKTRAADSFARSLGREVHAHGRLLVRGGRGRVRGGGLGDGRGAGRVLSRILRRGSGRGRFVGPDALPFLPPFV